MSSRVLTVHLPRLVTDSSMQFLEVDMMVLPCQTLFVLDDGRSDVEVLTQCLYDSEG